MSGRTWVKGQIASLLMGIALLCVMSAVAITLYAVGGSGAPEASAAYAELAVDVLPEETPPPQATQPVDATVFRVEVMRASPTPEMPPKRVLIYHTHTWEAYQQVDGDRYEETERWRTKDPQHNVTAVGRALAAALEAMGYEVVHDETAFEPPVLSTAYQRSLTMLEERTARGETYDLYIDLHRDAISSTSTIPRTVNIGGEDVARFMVLVGKGTNAAYDSVPDFAANHAIAERLTEALNRQADGLCRDIKVKTGRFNQHVAPRCVLIECGHNYNTLEQVLRGVPYLAQAIHQLLAQ